MPQIPPAGGGGGGSSDHGTLTGLTDDDHSQYQKESERNAVSGYAGLGSDGYVAAAQLGSGSGGATKFLREDKTFQAVGAGGAIADMVDVDGFTATAESLLNACDATTGFSVSGAHSGGVALSTTFKSQGTGSVYALMDMDINSPNPKLYYTFTTPEPIAGHVRIAFDVGYAQEGPNFTGTDSEFFTAKVGDGTALGGVVQSIPLGSFGPDTFQTIVIPIAGLSAIKSIGIERTSDTDGGGTARSYMHIDNIRFAADTKLDKALGSAVSVTAVAPPDYVREAAQLPWIELPAGKAIIAPGLGIFGPDDNGTLNLSGRLLDESGATDMSREMSTILSAAPQGIKVTAAPDAVYKMGGPLVLQGMQQVDVDFNGATLFWTQAVDAPRIEATGNVDVRLHNGRFIGFVPNTAVTGDLWTTVAGTPTTSGTTKLLDAQNEEIAAPVDPDTGLSFNYARQLGIQAGQTDTLLRNWVTVRLSDSAQVANDAVITIVDDHGNVLARTVIPVLTATATDYSIAFDPGAANTGGVSTDHDLRTKWNVQVKKATATANTITVTRGTFRGRVQFYASFEFGGAFVFTDCARMTVEDCLIEGFCGDATQSSSAGNHDILVRRVVSRGNCRQGMSFNRGTNISILDCDISETGRSGIDIEPFAETWFVRGLVIADCRFYNITNWAIAMGNWARMFEGHISDIEIVNAGVGAIIGGFNRLGGQASSSITNVRNLGYESNRDQKDFELYGIDMQVDNLVAACGVMVLVGTNDFDSGGGPVTYTSKGNVVTNVRIHNNAQERAVVIKGDHLVSDVSAFFQDQPSAYSTSSGRVFGPIDRTAGAPLFNVALSEARSQLSKTIKGLRASDPIWSPGGVDNLEEPSINVRGISGGATKPNNLRGVAAVVTASATTHAVAFPSKAAADVPAISAAPTLAATTGGSLTPSTSYFYKLAPRSKYGPRLPGTEGSVALNGSQNAVNITAGSMVSLASGVMHAGVTIYRGTATGVYTARYDVIPTDPYWGYQHDGFKWIDKGSTLEPNFVTSADFWAWPASVAVASGSVTPVDETGYEPDASYAVVVETNWNAGSPYITAKTTAGFTINFPTAAPGDGSGRVSWMLVR